MSETKNIIVGSIGRDPVRALGKPLTVCGIDVRTDSEGRYSLNDLHKAAGGAKRHSPAYFMERQQTQELAAEILSDTGIPVSAINKGGINQGTYVARELVYDYAKWISAKFNLQVIRAYDALATGDIAGAVAIAAPSFDLDRLSPAMAQQLGGHHEIGYAQSASGCAYRDSASYGHWPDCNEPDGVAHW